MPDYNLFGLSPRAFEQLVQALSTRIIGPNVVIFGDGPDGAREATFEGKVEYPNKRAGWNGSGIIQAKFLQRSRGTPKQDADWVLKQLALEMKKFGKRQGKIKDKRRSPHYYILATNVLLSAKAQSGGADRVDAAMKGYKRALGWRSCDVWDGEKISRFLDGHRDIATTYSAWITPGDVLQTVISKLGHERPDFEKVMSTYLQKELLDAQYANLRQAGHSDQERIPLSRVFVDLPVDSRLLLEPPDESTRKDDQDNSTPTFIETLFEMGSQRLAQSEIGLPLSLATPEGWINTTDNTDEISSIGIDRTAFASDVFERLKRMNLQSSDLTREKISKRARERVLSYAFTKKLPSQALSAWFETVRSGRIVLLGGPGQGKTTLGQFACQIYRAEILQGVQHTLAREVRDALGLIISQRGQAIAECRGRRYPLHIDLKTLASFLARNEEADARSLLEFLRQRIGLRTASELSLSDMKLWLQSYPWFIVFDGLDEVPASSNRVEVLKCISDFLVDADALDADLLVLATCRPQSYSKEFDERYFQHLWLAPLSKKRALNYGRRLLDVRYPKGSQENGTYRTRLREASNKPATARLMRSPLQVTIMTALVERVGRPPEQRWSLFTEYYRIIYDRETERGTKWSDVLRDHKPDVDQVHRQIGYLLQRRSETAGETEAKLTLPEFRELVSERLTLEGHTGQQLENLVSLMCEAVKDRLVFLAAVTDSHVGFEIRSLQEFMAADHLVDAIGAKPSEHEKLIQENLRSISTSLYWRNVFLFAAGRIFAKERHLREFILGLCQEANELIDDPAASAILAGSQLALDLLEDGSARNQPNTARALMRTAARLLDISSLAFHQRLAAQCSAMTEDVLKEELGRRLGSAQEPGWSASWQCLSDLTREEDGWGHALVKKYWRDDVDCLEKLFPLLSTLGKESPLLKRFAAVAHRLSPEFLLSRHRFYAWHDWEERENLLGKTNRLVSLSQANLDCNLSGFGNHENEIALRIIISLDRQEISAPVEEMPGDAHLGWQLPLAALRFLRQPNKETLSAELEHIAQRWEASSAAAFLPDLPWLIGECVASSQSASDLIRLAGLARAGEFGDALDWEKAEKRWVHGVKPLDIAASNGKTGCLSKAIGQQGFPIRSAKAYLRFLHISNRFEIWSALVKLAKTAEQPLRDLLLREIASYKLDVMSTDQRAEQLCCMLEMVAADLNLKISVALIAHSFRKDKPDELQVAFYDRLGRHAFLEPVTHDVTSPEFGVFLSQHYLRDPNRAGLLRILSLITPLETNDRIPRLLLEPDRWTEEGFKTSALTVLLDQLDWRADEAPSLARRIVAALPGRPDLISRLCDVLLRCNVTNGDLEAMPVALLQQLPAQYNEDRSRTVETLNNLVARRRGQAVL